MPTPPAPTPPPPPPPQTIELSGKVDDVDGSCPSLRFELRDRDVFTTSATEFSKGPCKDLRDGKDINLWGEIQANGSVRATRIEFKK